MKLLLHLMSLDDLMDVGRCLFPFNSFSFLTGLSILEEYCLILHLAQSLESPRFSCLVRVFSLALGLFLLCSTYSVLWNAATHKCDTYFQKASETHLISFVKGETYRHYSMQPISFMEGVLAFKI